MPAAASGSRATSISSRSDRCEKSSSAPSPMPAPAAEAAVARGQVGALSQQQRQIVAATFNVNRDRKGMTADKVRENSVVLALSQAKLRDQVDGLVTRMNSRLVQQDPSFKKIADLLPQAVAEMKNAEAKLQKADPQGALEPEQKALQILQHAEEEYQTQVQMGRQGGGGGGGGGQSAMARRPGRFVRARARQDGQPVRDGPARAAAAVRSAGRRPPREAEGARPAAGTGSRAPEAAGAGRAAGRRQRGSAAVTRRTGRGGGAPPRAAVAGREPA